MNQLTLHSGARARRGATAITVLVLLGLMFIGLVFSVDLARYQLADLELQCANDVATRAGADVLSRANMANATLAEVEQSVRDEIEMVAALNTSGGDPVVVGTDDIIFGNANVDPDTNGMEFVQSDTPNDLTTTTDAIQLNTRFDNFPMIFGKFVNTTHLDVSASTSAVVRERDMVLVLDRTTSMLFPDGGTIPVADYPVNLKTTEDMLYGTDDPVNKGKFSPWYPSMRVEFHQSGGNYVLTRMQALKLAVLRFREEIDASRGLEKLGVATYHRHGNTPSEASAAHQFSDGNAFDVTSPSFYNGDPSTASEAFKRIVGISASAPVKGDSTSITEWGNGSSADGITDTEPLQGNTALKHERWASSLEDAASGYPDFDHSYLAMRYGAATHITRGMLAGEQVLFGAGRRDTATPVMIVMTDGKENVGSDAATTTAEILSRHPDLRIYTVTFGADPDETDVPLMQGIAASGNGKHKHASDVTQLVEVFRELARSAGVALFE